MKWRKNKRMKRIIKIEDHPNFKGYKGVTNYRFSRCSKMITPNDVEVYRERCKDDV